MAHSPSRPVRPALRTYPLTIKQKIKETKDSVSFVFSAPEEHKNIFHYTPAQFLTFELKIKDETVLRSYSLSSCPLLNEELKTTVKRVTGGLVSNYMIDNLKEGDTLLSRPPAGRFFRPPQNLKPKHYFLFAGGSGITPLFSIIKTILLSDAQNCVHLLYANRDEDSIIYQNELKQWGLRYDTRFFITHILSRPKKDLQIDLQKTPQKTPQKTMCNIKGRLQTQHLEKYFADISLSQPDHLYYLCGPLGFMQTVRDFLTQKQVPKTQIRKESFFSAVATKRSVVPAEPAKTLATKEPATAPSIDETDPSRPEVILMGKQGEGELPSAPKTLRAVLNRETLEVSAEADIPILEQLLSAGHAPPFSCMSGSCMSCLAVLKRGRITQAERGILEDENLQNHEILTCQAIPRSSLVEVDYDSLD